MNLVDDGPLATPLIFDQLLDEDYPGEPGYPWRSAIYAFDWDAAWEIANQPIPPWQWEWRSPLRALQVQLIGHPDVTSWTQGAGTALAAMLREPTGVGSILSLSDTDTTILRPVVDSCFDSGEGDAGPPAS